MEAQFKNLTKLIKDIWKDPVWSKVIATFILFVVGSLYLVLKSFLQNENLISRLNSFWEFLNNDTTLILKNYTLGVIIIFGLSNVIILIRSYKLGKKDLKEEESIPGKIDKDLDVNEDEIVYYDCVNPKLSDFLVSKQKVYNNNSRQEIGERAGGSFYLVNDILNIERTDNNGWFTVMLQSYSKNGNRIDRIHNDSTLGQIREFQVSCEMKCLKSQKHTLAFVLRSTDSNEWMATYEFIVQSAEWKKF